MMNSIKKASGVVVAGSSAMLASFNASAAPLLDALTFDPQIADVTTDITTAGVALIGLAITAMSVKWVKATFF